jgi:hypothetical protein
MAVGYPTWSIILTIQAHRILQERIRSVLHKRQKAATVENLFGAADVDWPRYYGLLTGNYGLKSGATSSNPPPKSLVPDVKDLPGKTWPNAKRRKIRSGPYRMPPTGEKNLEAEIMKVSGMSNTYDIGIKRPCDGQCTILSVIGDLEYADGSLGHNTNGVSILLFCFHLLIGRILTE